MRDISRSIQYLESDPAQDAADNLERVFVFDDYVRAEAIHVYVQTIADAYRRESHTDRRLTVLFDALSDEKIESHIQEAHDENKADFKEVSNTERYTALEAIRGKILYELGFVLDAEEYALVTKTLKERGEHKTVLLRRDQGRRSVYKKFGLPGTFSFEHRHIMMEAWHKLAEAQQKAKEQGDPCPYIVDVEMYDVEDRSSIVKGLHLTTIDNELYGDFPSEFSAKDLFNALVDGIRGSIMLIENGLMLQDIKLDNIGIDKETGRGILFDLDGLYELNEIRSQIIMSCDEKFRVDGHGWTNAPPEVQVKTHRELVHIEARETEMVWQFGLCIDDMMISSTSIVPFQDIRNELAHLADVMMSKNPDTRPTLKDAEAQLSALIARIKE